MNSANQKFFVRSILAFFIIISVSITPFQKAQALSQGFEVASLGTGSGMVSTGKAKNIPALKYAGWGLIALGGTVVAADGVTLVFEAALLGAMFGALFGTMFKVMFLPFSVFTPRCQGQCADTSRIKLSDALNEVKSEVILASHSIITDDELAIQPVAQVLGVSTQSFARDFHAFIKDVESGKKVQANDSYVHCTQNPESVKAIVALFSNYQKAALL